MSRKVGQNKPTQKQTCSLTNPCKNKPSTDKYTNTNLHANNLHTNPHTNNYYIYKANKNRSHTKKTRTQTTCIQTYTQTNVHTNKSYIKKPNKNNPYTNKPKTNKPTRKQPSYKPHKHTSHKQTIQTANIILHCKTAVLINSQQSVPAMAHFLFFSFVILF